MFGSIRKGEHPWRRKKKLRGVPRSFLKLIEP
jgi:hypothetical protein